MGLLFVFKLFSLNYALGLLHRLVKLYPQSVSVSRARALMDVLVRAEEAEVCGELASFLHQVYLQQQRQSRGRANAPRSAGDEEQRSVRDITHDELLSLVWALISSCLGEEGCLSACLLLYCYFPVY